MSSSTSSESSSQQPITTSNAEQTLKLKTMISKEDETIDDWEQLDQIVRLKIYILVNLRFYLYVFKFFLMF